jgi:hypothetical protein
VSREQPQEIILLTGINRSLDNWPLLQGFLPPLVPTIGTLEEQRPGLISGPRLFNNVMNRVRPTTRAFLGGMSESLLYFVGDRQGSIALFLGDHNVEFEYMRSSGTTAGTSECSAERNPAHRATLTEQILSTECLVGELSILRNPVRFVWFRRHHL